VEKVGQQPEMPAKPKSDFHREIAHVLFIDVVGYSKMLIDEQSEALQALNEIVRKTEPFRVSEKTGKLIRIPAGDGMALLFFNSPEAPVDCALEISKAVRAHPNLRLRMGVHSGPVDAVRDVNDQLNVAGAGINAAQRVMDCGDAGHILLSKRVAEDLAQYREWRPYLHDLGEVEVKHGARIPIVNLYGDDVGNPELPGKLKGVRARAAAEARTGRVYRSLRLFVVMGAVLLPIILVLTYHRTPHPAGIGQNKSIAVLPFENLSEDKANAYFAEGIQDEILTRLSKIGDLKVISRTSTQRYKSKPENLPEIAKQLGVKNILEGSVQRAADQVRVNVQLLDAQSDSHLWAESYDRKLTDIFGVESEIAKSVAESLRAKLTGREEQALAVKPTTNPEAYDAYLRGLASEGQRLHSVYAMEKAAGFYERAVQLDPAFVLAWSRLCRADLDLYSSPSDPTGTRRDAAKRALDMAQKLQPNSPETLLALAYYQVVVLRDNELAKTTFRLVGKMLPGSSEVPAALAGIARRQGHWDETVAYYEQALVLDPRNTELLAGAASNYSDLRKFEAARKLCDRALDILPNDPDVMAFKATVYQGEGNLEEAAKLLREVNAETPSLVVFATKIGQLTLERNLSEALRLLQARVAQYHFGSELEKAAFTGSLAFTQRLAGDSAGAKITAEQARKTLEPVCKNQPDNDFAATTLSIAYAVLGNKNSALKEAERAIALKPSAEYAAYGPGLKENLALIRTIIGENSGAISTLGRLLEIPYHSPLYGTPVTPALLRLDPTWDPLRADPAFRKLCEEKKE
jgi:TolB-like protein/class 3 adenylate cyclase/Tfp pilus assembly protein PilF